jgi:hypothetical protein
MTMALKKAFPDMYGNNFEYWKISPEIYIDFAKRMAMCQVMVFASEAARKDGKRYMMPMEVLPPPDAAKVEDALRMSGKEFEDALATGDVRGAFYNRLKSLDLFSGAEDV